MFYNRQITLAARPTGLPKESDFRLVETPIPTPEPGEVLVRTLYLSVDPYMRGRMVDRASYVPPFQIGQPLSGGAVGKVVSVNDNPQFREGDYVLNFSGWREWFLTGPLHSCGCRGC